MILLHKYKILYPTSDAIALLILTDKLEPLSLYTTPQNSWYVLECSNTGAIQTLNWTPISRIKLALLHPACRLCRISFLHYYVTYKTPRTDSYCSHVLKMVLIQTCAFRPPLFLENSNSTKANLLDISSFANVTASASLVKSANKIVRGIRC